MATPPIGDKLLTPNDIKSTRSNSQRLIPDEHAKADDTVALSGAAPQSATPNTNLQTSEQVRARLEQLVGQLQSSPEQALAAHGKPRLQGLLSA